MDIVKVSHVMKHLNTSIIDSTSFSLVRWGDGGLKFIDAIIKQDINQMSRIGEKEGIPVDKMIEVMKLWGLSAKLADYIDSPHIYTTEKFWDRCKKGFKKISKSTELKLHMWREIYSMAEMDNVNFCNPEINFLSCLRNDHNMNILDIMKDRRVAFITACPEIKDKLTEFNVDIIPIVKQYEDHYHNSFINTTKIIEECANKYDLWLVAAGELGRVYSGMIKFYGGRTFDIGFIPEFWLHGKLRDRLRSFLKPNPDNHLELLLTEHGELYKEYI